MSEKKLVVIDTSAFMRNSKAIEKYIDDYEWVLTTIVEEELDNLSKSQNGEKAYQARNALRFIEKYEDKFTHIVNEKVENIPIGWDEEKHDNLIIGTAYNLGAMVFAYDRAFISKANTLGIERLSFNIEEEQYYKGYKKIIGNTEEINKFFEELKPNDFYQNEYLIIVNTDTNETSEMRFEGSEFVRLVLPKEIKGLNSQQRCVLDLLNNDNIPIRIIAGNFGSGKTYLTTQIGLKKVREEGKYSNLMIIRNPIGSGAEIGFLKGDKDDKTKDFFKSVIQHLDGGEWEAMQLEQQGKLTKEIPFYIKGLSIGSSFLLVDEAEDLTFKEIKLIGSRIEETSCVNFVGDYKQAENRYQYNNGLIQLIEKTKDNPLVGVVVLEEDVRSSASKVFAELE